MNDHWHAIATQPNIELNTFQPILDRTFEAFDRVLRAKVSSTMTDDHRAFTALLVEFFEQILVKVLLLLQNALCLLSKKHTLTVVFFTVKVIQDDH